MSVKEALAFAAGMAAVSAAVAWTVGYPVARSALLAALPFLGMATGAVISKYWRR